MDAWLMRQLHACVLVSHSAESAVHPIYQPTYGKHYRHYRLTALLSQTAYVYSFPLPSVAFLSMAYVGWVGAWSFS